MRLFDGPVPDQYYAVTSSLTARGHRRQAKRLIAASILALGLPPLLAAANPAASHIPGGRALLALSPLACMVFASLWLRHRWPTRGQSMTVVVLGTLLLAGGCIAAMNPFSGLLVATAFSFVLGYATLFHGARLRWFVIAAAICTIGWLVIRIGMTDVPTALAVSTPVVMIDVAVVFACRTVAEVAASGESRTDVEPLTGLLAREAFDDVAGNLIGARNRDDDRYLVIVVLTVDTFAALTGIKGRRGADRALVAVGKALRDTVRHDAVLGHVADAEFLVADCFTTPDPAPLAERIRGAIAATPLGITASIGVVCTPLEPLTDRPPNDVLDELIAVATTAMNRARRLGGNTTEYVIEPNAA